MVQWYVVVRRLRNGVAMFQKVAEFILRDVRDIAAVYVDDILTGTEWLGTRESTVEQHLSLSDLVLRGFCLAMFLCI